MIRKGRIDDLPQFWELGTRLLQQTPYASIEVDRQCVYRTFAQCINSSLCCCFVAEHDGKLSGVILGVAQEVWWSRSRSASDLMFYAERPGDGARLLKEFEKWAWNVPRMGDVTVAQSSGIDVDRMDALYHRRGYRTVGAVYCMTRSDREGNSANQRLRRTG
jgi:hypothetical protein